MFDEAKPRTNSTTKLGTVLLVDDDAGSLRLLGGVLESKFEILSTTSGSKAIQLAIAAQPDIIALDIDLPDLSGFQVCEAVAAVDALQLTPVVFVSRHDTEEHRARAFDLGAADYVAKPINAGLLVRRLCGLLETRRRTARRLEAIEARWRFALDREGQGLFEWDLEAATMTCSVATASLVDLQTHQLNMSRDRWERSIHPGDQPLVHAAVEEHLQGASTKLSVSYRIRFNEGPYVAIKEQGRVTEWQAGRPTKYLALLEPAESEAESTTRLKIAVGADHVTGLPDQEQCLRALEQTISNATASRTAGALLLISVDGIGELNRRFGHDVGDRVLQIAAERIALCQSDHFLGRMRGSEFALIVEGLSPQTASRVIQELAGRVVSRLSAPVSLRGNVHACMARVGVCPIGDQPLQPESTLRYAGIALNLANQEFPVQTFEHQMLQSLDRHTALRSDLERAIDRQELHLVYQPIVDSRGKPSGAEALARWIHPTRGFISPLEFISIAEESGLIILLGRLLRQQACTQLALWGQDPVTAQLKLSVNVSTQEFNQPRFVEELIEDMKNAGASPRLLQLELTESVLLSDFQTVTETMGRLRELGVSLALDDFGTGYSSLSYLKKLPIERLKIDRSFVNDIVTDPVDASLARAIVAVARSLGLEVVAEGTEDEQQVKLIYEMGCDRFQGYFFGRPDSAEQMRVLAQRAPSQQLTSLPPSNVAPLTDQGVLDASILIVDDDPNTLRIMGRILTGFRSVQVTTSPLDALDIASTTKPDLILIDARMPEMDGFQLMAELRKSHLHAETPIIFVTGILDPEVEVQALSGGAADFVTKPVSGARLNVTVCNQLRLKRQRDQLQKLATRDALTGVPNRYSFERALVRELSRSTRHDRALALLILDIDHFKSINDTHGHSAGDAVLRKIAQGLAAEISPIDQFFGRIGGEEFAVLLPDTEHSAADAVAERLRILASQLDPEVPTDPAMKVTISVGVALASPNEELSSAELLRRADSALYDAKNHGRNNVRRWAS